MRQAAIRIGVAATAATLLLASVADSAGGPKTKRISVKANGAEVAGAAADFPVISANGRYVAYESFGKLTGSDSGTMDLDIYVYDLKTKRNELVSVKSNGDDGTNIEGERADISADGRYVSFSASGALVGDDTNNAHDIYVRDRKKNKTFRVSLTANDAQVTGVDADTFDSSISGDGKHVAFQAEVEPFSATDQDDDEDIYVRDWKKGTTVQASLSSQNEDVAQGAQNPSISADGRYVAFDTFGVMTGQADSAVSINSFDADVFVRDMKKDNTKWVSLKENGEEGRIGDNANSVDPSISGNGKSIAFTSDAQLLPNDNNGFDPDIYVVKRGNGQLERASLKSNGDEVADFPSALNSVPELSASGNYVSWETSGRYTGKPDGGMLFRDVYRRDLRKNKTTLVSVKSNGKEVDANHQLSGISANGRVVVFSSMGAFTGGDDGSDFDVFVRSPVK